MPAGRVVARRSVRRRRSQRSLSGLGAASTARGGEAAAWGGERDSRKERSRKLERDTIPADPGSGAESPV